MEPFPHEYEFIELFETESAKLDEHVPFFYNNNIYKLCRPNGNLYFEMEPGSHWTRIAWKQEENLLVDLVLENVKGMEIEKRSGKEFLHLYFDEGQGLRPLIIKTKPDISLIWGTVRD